MNLAELLGDILKVAEKAARLARVIRSEEALFKLLVEEKTGEAKNKRFVQDFKTLADVLVQEMVRHYLSGKFEGIGDSIYGEESNKFTNTLGETVAVEIQNNAEETCALLNKVLDGNEAVARILSTVIHEPLAENPDPELGGVQLQVTRDDIGIWIDPIDSTAQYISGVSSSPHGGIHSEGLQCVLVLIGVYQKSTGEPIAGVINQPFAYQKDTVWHGRCVWGLCHGGVRVNNIRPCRTPASQNGESTCSMDAAVGSESARPVSLVMSSSESHEILSKLQPHFSVHFVAGAGYKILCVIDALCSAYVLSTGSTSKWDTCGPHAILRSLGGGIANFSQVRDCLKRKSAEDVENRECDVAGLLSKAQLTYHTPDGGQCDEGQRWANRGGVLAYLSVDVVDEIWQKM